MDLTSYDLRIDYTTRYYYRLDKTNPAFSEFMGQNKL